MRMTRKKKITIAALSALTLIGGGTAIAYWTTSGTGTGAATVGTSQAVTVTQLGAITGLTPGSPAQAIDFRINNPLGTNQTISSVVVSISGVTGASPTAAIPCTAVDFTIVQPTATYGDLTPGDHDYQPSGATLKLENTAANQDDCKGAVVDLAFTAS